VTAAIFLGEHTEYLVRHDQLGEFLALMPRQAEAATGRLSPGDAVVATWPPGAALILEDDRNPHDLQEGKS
jgi:spermidine/putrescine transport system ATP-binding protein